MWKDVQLCTAYNFFWEECGRKCVFATTNPAWSTFAVPVEDSVLWYGLTCLGHNFCLSGLPRRRRPCSPSRSGKTNKSKEYSAWEEGQVRRTACDFRKQKRSHTASWKIGGGKTSLSPGGLAACIVNNNAEKDSRERTRPWRNLHRGRSMTNC